MHYQAPADLNLIVQLEKNLIQYALQSACRFSFYSVYRAEPCLKYTTFTGGVCVKAVHVMRISDPIVMLILCPCTGLSTPGRITKGSRTRSVTRDGASPSKRLAAGKQARSLRSRPPQAPGKRERGSWKCRPIKRYDKHAY